MGIPVDEDLYQYMWDFKRRSGMYMPQAVRTVMEEHRKYVGLIRERIGNVIDAVPPVKKIRPQRRLEKGPPS